MPDWEQLRVVLAIHRAGSMQAAAEGLGIDRTTVLRRLDALEREFQARLFDRSSDGCRLTARGEEILGTVEQIEASMARLGQRIGGTSATASGAVRLTVPEFFAAAILAPALPGFRDRHPGIELQVANSNRHLNLIRGEADVALRNRWPEQTSLIARKAASVGFGCYASQGYIARNGVPAGSFAGHDLVLPGEELSAVVGYDRMLELASAGRIVHRSSEFTPLVFAAKAHLGIAYLPCMATHGHPDLVGVWPGRVGDLRDIFVVMRAEAKAEARFRVVFDFIVDLCREHAAVIAGRDLDAAFPPAAPGA